MSEARYLVGDVFACVGWPADPTCPAWNAPMHGCTDTTCTITAYHGYRTGVHVCPCGATATDPQVMQTRRTMNTEHLSVSGKLGGDISATRGASTPGSLTDTYLEVSMGQKPTPPTTTNQPDPADNPRLLMMPACWEDMVALGLDPLTGEPAEDAA